MLHPYFQANLTEAGCDEAGRGCLAGPVVAAAVILSPDFDTRALRDSKVLSADKRERLRIYIEKNAMAWGVSSTCNEVIDNINILNASFDAMHKAIDLLDISPDLILVDGNRFKPYPRIPHKCIIKGDATYASIAAASILAKTYRDEMMRQYHERYPDYGWYQNKGYPTQDHRQAIALYGETPLHRKSFNLRVRQLKMF
ncbi:MAG: ribonuclease HII [Bacteroidia bacterium]|jgi:ribonuclease HII